MTDTGTPVPEALIEETTRRSHNRAWPLFLATGLWGLYAFVLFVAGQKRGYLERDGARLEPAKVLPRRAVSLA